MIKKLTIRITTIKHYSCIYIYMYYMYIIYMYALFPPVFDVFYNPPGKSDRGLSTARRPILRVGAALGSRVANEA